MNIRTFAEAQLLTEYSGSVSPSPVSLIDRLFRLRLTNRICR